MKSRIISLKNLFRFRFMYFSIIEKIFFVILKFVDKLFKSDFSYLYYQKLLLNLGIDKWAQIRKLEFENLTGQKLDYLHPQNYSQKMQQILFYDYKPLKTTLADKYLVKEYVENKIGGKYVIPLIGAYDNFEDIDFSILPNSFILKTNHASGNNVIVKDKDNIDYKNLKRKFNRWLQRNYAVRALEVQYRDIKPKIIVEKLIAKDMHNITECKIICILGEPQLIHIISNEEIGTNHQTIFDANLNIVSFKNAYYPTDDNPTVLPDNIDEIISLSKVLSKDFDFVRVDFYVVDNKIYFGEMTFSPSAFFSGIIFESEKWEKVLSERANAYMLTGPRKEES